MESKKSKIQEIYDDPKAKGFVNHLFSAYVPVSKVSKLFGFEKNHNKKHQCVICKTDLISVNELFQNFQEKQEVISKDFIKSLKDLVNGIPTENPIAKHVAGDKIMAFTGEKTDTVLCHSCIQDLMDLVQNGLLTGDKNITWKVNQLQRSRFFNQYTESNQLSDTEKSSVKKIEKKIERSKTKTSTFGDLQVLQDLKAKMK